MKRYRITSALLAFFLVFSLIGTLTPTAYALKAKDLGIIVSDPKMSYINGKGQYKVEVPLKNNGYHDVYISAYVYNADGKRIISWNNGGKGFLVNYGNSSNRYFSLNYSKYPSKSYTFVYQAKVKGYWNEEKRASEDRVFTWKWKITKEEACGPSIKFKKSTFMTLKDGRVVPRINYNMRNLKGQSYTVYVYDENGDLVRKAQGKAQKTNNGNCWFYWDGISDGQQYPDDDYTVKIVTSGGVSASKKCYFDFQYNNK